MFTGVSAAVCGALTFFTLAAPTSKGHYVRPSYQPNVEIFYDPKVERTGYLFKEQLAPLVDTRCFDQVNFSYVPYGDVFDQKRADGKYDYQCTTGGKDQCNQMAWQLCALNVGLKRREKTRALLCMDASDLHASEDEVLDHCFTNRTIKAEIRGCVENKEKVYNLTRQAQIATLQAPRFEGRDVFPWILVNGLGYDSVRGYSNLAGYICEYAGRDSPCCRRDFGGKLTKQDEEDVETA